MHLVTEIPGPPPVGVASAQPVESPGRRSTRYYSLDIWRGLACLMVVVFHSTWYAATQEGYAAFLASDSKSLTEWLIYATSKCWCGVPMFFVISGYCIAATADSSRRKSGSAGDFFVRRVRRIYPPYWAAIAICFVLAGVCYFVRPDLLQDGIHPVTNPMKLDGWQWLANATLTESWRGNFVGPSQPAYFLDVAWTLCFEEQFYLVTGLALFLFPKRFFEVLLAISVIALLNSANLNVRFVRSLGIDLNAYQLPLYGCFIREYWIEFAAGILVYYRINYAGRRMGWLINIALAIGVAIVASSGKRLLEFQANSYQFTICALSFALLLSLVHPADHRVANARMLKPLAICGTMCYSLYLIHNPIVKLTNHIMHAANVDTPLATLVLTVPTCLIASLVASWCFHCVIERRFLNKTSVV